MQLCSQGLDKDEEKLKAGRQPTQGEHPSAEYAEAQLLCRNLFDKHRFCFTGTALLDSCCFLLHSFLPWTGTGKGG